MIDAAGDPERLLESPSLQVPQQRDRNENMSAGISPSGDDMPAANGGALAAAAPAASQNDPFAEQVNSVIHSEIGVQTLLIRLKQSIATAKEFALFLKKRSTLEEEHANGLRKVCRITHENLHRPEHRQGSFAQSYDEITRVHERMADNGLQFAASLHQMHEDLMEIALNGERGRKHWKQTGLAAEQRLVDTEMAMRKSKAKYDSIAEDYDRARTGDRQSGKKFGLKGPKSAAQHEEELLRKVQAADGEYGSKVQFAQTTRAEHLSKGRPEAIKSIQDLIRECDAALTLQMQKFATFNEKLLLHNGLCVSPVKGPISEQGKDPRSLRDVVSAIDNEKDFSHFITSYTSSIPSRPSEIKYERNPVLNVMTASVPLQAQRQPEPSQNFGPRQGASGFGATNSQQSPGGSQAFSQHSNNHGYAQQQVGGQGHNQGPPIAPAQQHDRSFSQGQAPFPPQHNPGSVGGNGPNNSLYNSSSMSPNGPPQLSTLPFQNSPLSTSFPKISTPPPQVQTQALGTPNSLPPLKLVFGMSLDQLFERDSSAVPMTVYQCILAVDTYGLDTEGIYRVSGNSSHINRLKAMFNNDASKVDFRNPENFFHDVNSVAGLLKQFLRELPDPLLTAEHYSGFIEASKSDDDTVRRDSLHAIINSLPDPNYATLRALTLHLNRVQENSHVNRMNANNLSIVFGPTMMGASTGPNIQDAGWQVRVVNTILDNTYQIFDDD